MNSMNRRFRMVYRHIVFSAAAVLLLAAVSARGQSADGVRLLRSDAAALELEIVPQISWGTLPDGTLLPSVNGGGIANPDRPGAPLELHLTIPVGLPAPEGSRFEVLSVEYGTPVFGRIAPVPELVKDKEEIYIERRKVDEGAYLSYVPQAPAAEFRYGGIARGLHMGEIVVTPVRYVAGAKKIEVVSRVRVRLTYGGVPVRSASGGLPPMPWQGALANAAVSERWTAERTPAPLARRSAASAARAWMRVEVGEDGFYAILPEDFEAAGINPSSITNVTVYGGRGVPLPESVGSADTNLMNRVPVIVERDGGKISRVVFFGAGTTGWQFVPFDFVDSVPRRVNNPYVKANSYIVAVDGEAARDFPMQENVGAATVTPGYGIARYLFEEDLTNAIAQGNSGNGGGRNWFGSSFVVDDFRPEEKRVFTQELFGLERSYPIAYRAVVAHYAVGSGQGTFSLEQNGTSLGEAMRLYAFTEEGQAANGSEKVYVASADQVPADNRSLLGVTYRMAKDATGYLDWYEIHYGRKLQAQNNRIIFESPTGTGVAEYRVSGFNTNNLIGLDITDPANPVRLNPVLAGGGDFVFRGPLSDNPKARRRYYIGSPGDAKRVSNVGKARFADLRSSNRSADILVITHEDLREAAEKYVAYRNEQGRLSATFVTTEEIYTEYSSGNLDPTAIRDFVSHAYHNWSKPPRYVLILGDANYDYRGLTAGQKQYVPVYEIEANSGSYNDIAVSAFDDYYVRVDGEDFYVDLAIGRIAVDNLEDAETVIEKIRRYENGNSFGDWRKRVILVADDRWPVEAGGTFVPQSEELEHDFLPKWVEAEKIYLPEYPTVQTVRRSKPGATQDMLQWLNRGALIINWVGHGNARVWGHEHILNKDEFVPQLNNDTALTMVIAVTCNFGRFDNPGEVSGGELFLTHKRGGAVAVLATTRAVYIGDNRDLMRAYFSSLFFRDSVTHDFLPLGDAMMVTKFRAGASRSNDQKYIIFGDPAMRLNLPKDSVEILTINSVDVHQDTATVGALSLVTVEGVIRNRMGDIREDFNGTAIVSLYDADQHKTLIDEGSNLAMLDRGGQLFRGPAIVKNGRFTSTFRVPKDIAFDTINGRVYAYAYNETEDAAGATCNVKVYGSDTAQITDKDGPDIRIFMDDRTFRSGDVVTPTPMLIIDLEDGSGVNASGAGLGHRIEAWIGDSPTPIDLTEFYTTSPTDYRTGSAEREVLDLEPGEYKVRVRAWDIFNNPAETSAFFRIVEGDAADLVVTDVVNYPNPMGKETEFLFRHNQSRPLDVRIDIFTAAGRKVQQLESRNVTDRFVRVPWNGLDRDGRRLANGVYFYRLRVAVAGEEGEGKSVEIIEKVAVAQ